MRFLKSKHGRTRESPAWQALAVSRSPLRQCQLPLAVRVVVSLVAIVHSELMSSLSTAMSVRIRVAVGTADVIHSTTSCASLDFPLTVRVVVALVALVHGEGVSVLSAAMCVNVRDSILSFDVIHSTTCCACFQDKLTVGVIVGSGARVHGEGVSRLGTSRSVHDCGPVRAFDVLHRSPG